MRDITILSILKKCTKVQKISTSIVHTSSIGWITPTHMNDDGILIMNVIDFLKDNNSLAL